MNIDQYILSEKKSCDSKLFYPYSVNIESMDASSILMETAFISEELCMKNFVLVAAAEEYQGQIYSRGILSKIALWHYVDRLICRNVRTNLLIHNSLT